MKIKNALLYGLSGIMAFTLSACGSSGGASSATSSVVGDDTASTAVTTADTAQASSSESTTSTDVVTLEFYFFGDEAKDDQMVLDKINERLRSDLNCEMHVNYVPFSNFQTQYPLLFASQTEMDGVFSSYWCGYAAQARKNAYMEITEDMLKQYAPETYKNTPEDAWNQAKVDGKLYMIPQTWRENLQPMVGIRGDLREKYGLDGIKTVEDLEAYMQAVRDNESGIVPYTADSTDGGNELRQLIVTTPNEWASDTSFPQLYATYNINDAKPEIFSLLETEEYKAFVKRMYDWNQKGYISKDSLSNETWGRDLFDNGKIATYFYNSGTINNMQNLMDESIKSAGGKVEIYDISGDAKLLPYAFTGGGLSIAATSKHPELVLEVIDLLRNDKEMNWLVERGIQGRHWDFSGDKNDDGTLNENSTVPGPNSADYGTNWICYSAFRNWDYQAWPADAACVPGYKDMLADFANRAQSNIMQSFVFDSTEYTNQLAALNNVVAQYATPLELGFVDPDEGYNKLMEQLKAAGYDEVLAAYQEQAKTFLESAE